MSAPPQTEPTPGSRTRHAPDRAGWPAPGRDRTGYRHGLRNPDRPRARHRDPNGTRARHRDLHDRSPDRAGRAASDRGQVAIEYLGFLPLLLLVGLLAIQLGAAAYAANQAGTGARAAARMAATDRPETSPEQAGRSAMGGWFARNSDFSPSEGARDVTYTARVRIPVIVPGLDWGPVERSATMPLPSR
ncbi:pilus assembly protein [Streptomyces sp. LP05-1]|uniref:Pilus assembly protein n=1 Tax=Streptomyces pyxinae TaxID=2970734 RepID=A0ABT2CAY0_9ACTN|nr:TadE/TadG family type IV pilus assembly protein [Streptomyces sp. LP05-1]MCS0634521.1 pilus assembly protein [Streptomyces sp. LP05-1]